jgi:hypothetical protein
MLNNEQVAAYVQAMQAADYPPMHAFVYGDSGVGKSTFIATFPKPLLVMCFDPYGKDIPYRKNMQGKMTADSGLLQMEIPVRQGVVPLYYRDVQREDGIVRIEYYHEHDVDFPTAMSCFRYRMSTIHQEYAVWKTLAVDSVTLAELAARAVEEKLLNPVPDGKSRYSPGRGSGFDARQWFGGSTDTLEDMFVRRFASLPMNVILACHIHERTNAVSGEILRGPYAPGRLYSRGELSSAFQEQYHMYTDRDGETGQRVHQLQTQNRDGWVATTQIDAPDPCYPHYLSLWENFR